MPQKRTFAVAVVGAGPSGFYAAEALLRASDDISVWMFEKLPVPYGLVRYGVAPDHPKLKAVTAVFDRIAGMDGFHFCGNVEIGRDVSVAAIQEHFHAVIFAHGPASGAELGIPGEDLPGSHTAHAFVAWYNGHPDYRDLTVDLRTEAAAVIGNGNVALDVARILAKPIDELRKTDIADHALEVLAESQIRDIHVIGRRGPAQVNFVSKELREFSETEGFRSIVDPADMDLGVACKEELEDTGAGDLRLCAELLGGFVHSSQKAPRTCHFHFHQMPVAITGDARARVLKLRLNKLIGSAFAQRAVQTNEAFDLSCGLVVSSVGYKPALLEPLALARDGRHLDHANGRLVENGTVLTGLYVTGWAKRGPNGTIGTNRGDSQETVATLLTDKPMLAANSRQNAASLLEKLRPQMVTYDDWLAIDAREKTNGAKSGRPRVKLTSRSMMLSVHNMLVQPTL